MTAPSEPTRTRNSAIKIAIAVIPALLIFSICIALWLGANADQEESEPIVGEVTVAELEDYLKKVQTMIGEREVQTEDGQHALRQVAAMTLGSLGPENLGYEIFKSQTDSASGLLWPTIWIKAGDRESKNPVVVAVPQAEKGTGVAFAYGFAEYLTSHTTKIGVRIVFYPPLYDDDLPAWIWARCGTNDETMAGFLKVCEGVGELEVAEIYAPEEKRNLVAELAGQKGWEGNVKVADEASEFLEVRLAEGSRSSRSEQAQRIIRMMPLVKDLVERLGE